MSRVNLLPPEVRRARADAKRARSVVVVAAALAALLGGVYLVRTLQVLSLNGDLADVRSEQATVQAEIDSFFEREMPGPETRALFEAGYPRLAEFLPLRDSGISSAMSRRLLGS